MFGSTFKMIDLVDTYYVKVCGVKQDLYLVLFYGCGYRDKLHLDFRATNNTACVSFHAG